MPELPWVVDLAWKSAVIAALALLLLRVARTWSASQRSFLAHAGLISTVALPPATLLLPAWSPLPATSYPALDFAAPVAFAPTAIGTDTTVLPPVDSDPVPITLWLYLAPAMLLLLTLLTAIVRLWSMRHRAAVLVDAPWLTALASAQRRMGFKHGTALLVSDELRSPISWGVMRPTIVLDPAAVAAAGDAEAIIAHELAHVARLDWAKLLLARLACALFWFNPLVWLLARESHQLREEAADDAVLLADVGDADYAALLVSAARHDNAGVLLAAHGVAPGRGSLKRRIARVLDGTLSRAPVSAGVGALGLLLVAAVAGPLAAFGPGAAETAVPAPATMPTVPALAALPAAAVPAIEVAMPAARERPVAVAPDSPQQRPSALIAGGRDPTDKPKPHHGAASLDDIVAAKAVGVDPAYVDQLTAIFPGVRLRDLIAARAVGVTPAYARSVRQRFPAADLDDLVQMRALGVSASDVSMGGPQGRSLTEVHGRHGTVRAEVTADGRAVTRVTRGDRSVFTVSEPADPPEPPDPHEDD
jgi:beta-lactamase regulating signal transducer with metallopeptidase domain